MKRLILLLTLILTALSANCQDGYPKLIHYEGDTLILISENQAIVANIVNAELVRHMELTDSLRMDLQRHKTTIIRIEDAMVLLQRLSDQKDARHLNAQELVNELGVELEKAEKKLQRAQIWNKILGSALIVLGVVVVLVGG